MKLITRILFILLFIAQNVLAANVSKNPDIALSYAQCPVIVGSYSCSGTLPPHSVRNFKFQQFIMDDVLHFIFFDALRYVVEPKSGANREIEEFVTNGVPLIKKIGDTTITTTARCSKGKLSFSLSRHQTLRFEFGYDESKMQSYYLIEELPNNSFYFTTTYYFHPNESPMRTRSKCTLDSFKKHANE